MYASIIKSRPARLWLLLNILDLLLTIGIIHLGGTEVMPIAGWFLKQGIAWFVAFKLSFTLLAAVILLNISGWASKVCNGTMCIIIVFNFISLSVSLI
jgi:hypothetical protein